MPGAAVQTTLFLFSILALLVQTQAFIYHDFQDFERNEILQYGILHIGSNLELLNWTDNKTSFLGMKTFYVRYAADERDKVGDFCRNHKVYLKDKDVLFNIRNADIGFLAQCLKNTSKSTSSDLARLTIIRGTKEIGTKEPIHVLQSMGVKFGLGFRRDEQPTTTLNKYRNLNVTVNVVAKDWSYPNSGEYVYNLNYFVGFFEEKYYELAQSISGYNPKLFGLMGCIGSRCNTHIYFDLQCRSAYRWGEMRKRFVLCAFPSCSNLTNKVKLARCLEKVLYRRTSPSPSFSIQAYHGGINASAAALEPSLACIYFDSIFIEVDDSFETNYNDLFRLAIVHSNSPCKVIWNMRWNMEKYFNLSVNLNKTSILKHLSIIATQHPGLIGKVFAVLPKMPLDGVNTETSKFMQSLSEVSDVLNGSLILLLDYDHNEAAKLTSWEKLVNYSQIFNFSVGVSINILESSVNWDILKNVAENYESTNFTILINYYGKRVEENRVGDCIKFKMRWDELKNWAHDNKFHVVVRSHGNFWENKEVFSGTYYKPYFKNYSIFGEGYAPENATKEELQFLSNFQDHCIEIPHSVPSTPVSFNTAYAGVTFNLTSEKYSSLRSEELAELIQLIQFKFKTMEVVPKHLSALESFQQAIKRLEKNANSTGVRKYKYRYYVDISSVGFSSLENFRKFAGFHTSLCLCKSDQIMLAKLQSASVENIGISLRYEDAVNPDYHELWKNLVLRIDYVVINVNVAEALLTATNSFKSERSTSLNITIYDYIKNNPSDISPNPVFDNIRAVRLNIKRWNSNAIVYIRIAWPTVQNTRSTERTQKLWEYLDDFSNVFKFPFFISEAFDSSVQRCTDRADLQYGWWRVTSDKDVGNSGNYIDKQAEYYDLETPRPNRTTKISNKLSQSETVPITEIGACVLGILLVVIIVTAVVIYRIRLTLQMLLTKEELREFEMGRMGPDSDDETHDNDYCSIAYDKEKYEINKAAINLDNSAVIGSGNFGIVYKAAIQNHEKPVAVKVPKICGKVELLSVLREIKLLSFVGEHENILKLVAAYTREVQKGIVYVITEFVENGSLLEYLRKIPNAKKGQEEVLLQLNRFCLEISKGMQYLSERKVIHGDLSTRNVLLDASNTCKISDFGLSRKLCYMDLYVKQTAEPVPWRWMAVEALERSELSLKTDIWSLGVTVWEIYSFAEEPYQSVSWDLEFSKKLMDGLRLPKPELADQSIYEMMLSCWKIDPEERPSPSYFIDFFQSLRSLTYTQL